MLGLSTGNLMFYGGMIGAGLSLLGLVIALFAFRSGKRRLRRKLDEEYGKGGLEVSSDNI